MFIDYVWITNNFEFGDTIGMAYILYISSVWVV